MVCDLILEFDGITVPSSIDFTIFIFRLVPVSFFGALDFVPSFVYLIARLVSQYLILEEKLKQ